MEKLRKLRDVNVIKVLMGVRRCGKSTIMEAFRDELIETGVPGNNIQFRNFELPENAKPWRDLYDDIVQKLVENEQNYIFFDEVQIIENFEKLVDGLHARKNCDIYITGSNAMLLSGELATFLSGRYISIEIYPLSFAEYLSAFSDNKTLEERYEAYTNYSSFPEATNIFKLDSSLIDDYLSDIYDSILTKDIMKRRGIKQRSELERVAEFMFDSIGSVVSPTNIATTLSNSKDKNGIVNKTVDNYLEALSESYILYPVQRYDVKGKKLLKTLKKYYTADIALSRAILNRPFNTDLGHLLENIVYLELRRKGGRVTIGKVRNLEVDFVHTLPNGDKNYYQVAYTAKEQSTLDRELASLRSISDHNPKYLITTDPTERNIDGIRLINAYKWLANAGSA
jgi:predicted AAA+ superfamily ATPase